LHSIASRPATKSTEEGVALPTGPGFQEEAGARNKWRRATPGQEQLSSYATGYTEIVALRQEVQPRAGSAFKFKNFNEQSLSYGSAPVKYIRNLMLRR